MASRKPIVATKGNIVVRAKKIYLDEKSCSAHGLVYGDRTACWRNDCSLPLTIKKKALFCLYSNPLKLDSEGNKLTDNFGGKTLTDTFGLVCGASNVLWKVLPLTSHYFNHINYNNDILYRAFFSDIVVGEAWLNWAEKEGWAISPLLFTDEGLQKLWDIDYAREMLKVI